MLPFHKVFKFLNQLETKKIITGHELVKARFIIEPVFFITVGTRDHNY